MSLLGGTFEFTPFDVALRDTVEWLVDHYDTDARIGRRTHANNGVYNGAANGNKKNGMAVYVDRVETIEADLLPSEAPSTGSEMVAEFANNNT